jgi:hypothetical protein
MLKKRQSVEFNHLTQTVKTILWISRNCTNPQKISRRFTQITQICVYLRKPAAKHIKVIASRLPHHREVRISAPCP